MKADLTYTYLLSAVSTLITLSVAYFRYSKKASSECGHLVEFFASMLFVTTVSFLTWNLGPLMIGLSMLSWVWPLRTMLFISQDLSGKALFQRDHYVALLVGMVFSLILFMFDYETLVFSAPMSVSFGLVGCSFLFQSLYKTKIPLKPLYVVYFTLMAAFILSRATFPIWISYDESMQFGVLFDCYVLMLFNVTLIPLYFETFSIANLETALYVRNQQLFNRSSFSEFKILSSGIAHEINNALTVINAKTEQLMRIYKGPDEQKGLRLVLTSADRIGKSIRSLREFIYPQKTATIEILSVKDLLNSVLMIYGQRLRNHGAFVTINGNSDQKVKGHRILLEQVLLSLINGSLEAIDKLSDKWIDITFVPEESKVSIIIKDSSKGLDDQVADRILDQSLTIKNAEDNSLGLIIAKEIIERHGGTLTYLKGKLNRTFQLELPVVIADEAEAELPIETEFNHFTQLH